VSRRSTPAAGVDEFAVEPATGVIDDPDELAAARRRRPTDKRIAHIEKRLDEAVSDGKKTADAVGKVAEGVAEMRGELRTALNHIALGHATEQVRIGSRAKVIVGVVGAVCTAAGAIVAAIVAQGCV
jgi:hypothetical protein